MRETRIPRDMCAGNTYTCNTGKTLRRRKVLTKAVKKQITKHIRELNPTNVSLL